MLHCLSAGSRRRDADADAISFQEWMAIQNNAQFNRAEAEMTYQITLIDHQSPSLQLIALHFSFSVAEGEDYLQILLLNPLKADRKKRILRCA